MAGPQSKHLDFGKTGEQTAAAALAGKGMAVLERNWRHGHLEIDLICEEKGQIVFVEVKTRRKRSRGGGSGALTLLKQRRLIKAAQYWLSLHGLWEKPCRFDLLCLYGNGDTFQIDHYRNAFTASLDCSYAPW